jgi:hypothetical protein
MAIDDGHFPLDIEAEGEDDDDHCEYVAVLFGVNVEDELVMPSTPIDLDGDGA